MREGDVQSESGDGARGGELPPEGSGGRTDAGGEPVVSDSVREAYRQMTWLGATTRSSGRLP
jgi:hypothetical protein